MSSTTSKGFLYLSGYTMEKDLKEINILPNDLQIQSTQNTTQQTIIELPGTYLTSQNDS